MNQLLFSRLSLAHSGAASPARINRSSLDPARSASQRRSPVVEGLPKKIFLSAGRDTHLRVRTMLSDDPQELSLGPSALETMANGSGGFGDSNQSVHEDWTL